MTDARIMRAPPAPRLDETAHPRIRPPGDRLDTRAEPLLLAVEHALRQGSRLADDVLDSWIDRQPCDADRKALALGLKGARLIGPDQCAMQFYRRPSMRGA